jgi:hypothetical protein
VLFWVVGWVVAINVGMDIFHGWAQTYLPLNLVLLFHLIKY